MSADLPVDTIKTCFKDLSLYPALWCLQMTWRPLKTEADICMTSRGPPRQTQSSPRTEMQIPQNATEMQTPLDNSGSRVQLGFQQDLPCPCTQAGTHPHTSEQSLCSRHSSTCGRQGTYISGEQIWVHLTKANQACPHVLSRPPTHPPFPLESARTPECFAHGLHVCIHLLIDQGF